MTWVPALSFSLEIDQANKGGAHLGWAKTWGEVRRGWVKGIFLCPHPYSLFFTLSQFSSPLWAFGKGKKMTAMQAIDDVILIFLTRLLYHFDTPIFLIWGFLYCKIHYDEDCCWKLVNQQQLPVLPRFVMEMLFIAERGDKSKGAFCKIGRVSESEPNVF